jgi:hypothetical protein
VPAGLKKRKKHMTSQSEPSPRQGTWAQPVNQLRVFNLPKGVANINVDGRKVAGPVQGFGQLWQKTYTIRLVGSSVSPQALVQSWKENFATFWPQGNHFYNGSLAIAPGQVALLHLAGPGGFNPPGGPLISTGILVIYADEESFSFMTPQGHMFAGMITFSAYRQGDETVAQVQVLERASDPLFELTFRLGFGSKMEDEFWLQTLSNLANHFKAPGSQPQLRSVVVDPHMQWGKAKNIWYNAAIRTALYILAAPFRWLRNRFRKQNYRGSAPEGIN